MYLQITLITMWLEQFSLSDVWKQKRDHFKCLRSKNNCCLLERLFKVKKNGIYLFTISFFVLEIFTFLHYANEESDDVIGGFTIKQYSTQSRISAQIMEQCSSNLATETYTTKETEWHLLCCCHGNTFISSLSL